MIYSFNKRFSFSLQEEQRKGEYGYSMIAKNAVDRHSFNCQSSVENTKQFVSSEFF